MSEYVLKIDDKPQAEALLIYLRSLDFVELLPKQTGPLNKQAGIDAMQAFLAELPKRDDYTQDEVNQAIHDIRAGRDAQ